MRFFKDSYHLLSCHWFFREQKTTNNLEWFASDVPFTLLVTCESATCLRKKTLFYKSTTLMCCLALPVKLQERRTQRGSDADPRRQNACQNVESWRGNTLGCPWRRKAETTGHWLSVSFCLHSNHSYSLWLCFCLPPPCDTHWVPSQ